MVRMFAKEDDFTAAPGQEGCREVAVRWLEFGPSFHGCPTPQCGCWLRCERSSEGALPRVRGYSLGHAQATDRVRWAQNDYTQLGQCA